MTDRVKGFIVTLKDDTRDDDAESIVNALKMVKGVLDVSPVAAKVDDHMNRLRIRHELGEKLWTILYPKEGK